MNKDVVYIEPEDDITDILSRIKGSTEKVVALVPPKKLGVLRSAVNEKLIAKTAKAEDKLVVIITTDQALLKLAANAGLPVAKTLQSRPVMPGEAENIPEEKKAEEVIEEENDEAEESIFGTPNPRAAQAKEPDEVITSTEIDEIIEEDTPRKSKRAKDDEEDEAAIPSLDKYRKFIVAGVAGGFALIVFLVWALVFAPAARIIVSVKTTPSNFSENVSFVTKQEKEDVENGKFFLEEQKYEDKASVEFEATGEKDVGEKAAGTLNISATLVNQTKLSVPAGTTFTYGSLKFVATKGVTFTAEASDGADCLLKILNGAGCSMPATIEVQASEIGENYNIVASNTGWTSGLAGVTVESSSEMTGGSSKTVKVITKEDVTKATAELETTPGASKEDLKSAFGDDILVIESSYSIKTGSPTVSPKVGEEVKDGVTPKLEVITSASMYGVEKAKIESYVTKLAEQSLAEDQRLYSIGEPFFERYLSTKDSKTKEISTTARLKTTTYAGPKISDEDILEKSKGQTVNEVRTLIKSINGISKVEIQTSYPWVRRIPNGNEKVKIVLTINGEAGESTESEDDPE